ncbi:MAG TPA: hypothetical protein VNI84_12165 [Pyrinomonadaceae bacterium]|nr:hypothetical protein [Pyrinomonadaceae bacterium]
MKFTRTFAVFAAFAFVLCAFVFSPPDVFAGQSQPFSKDSVCAKSQVEIAAVNQAIVSADFNAVLPQTDDLIGFGVTSQYSPPIARRALPKTDNYKGLNRQRPEQPPNRS